MQIVDPLNGSGSNLPKKMAYHQFAPLTTFYRHLAFKFRYSIAYNNH